MGFAVLAILIECLSQRDVLRNKVVFPGSLLDCCPFTRPECLSFFQASEALPLSDLVGIRDVNEITAQGVIPNRPGGEIFVLSHKLDFTSLPCTLSERNRSRWELLNRTARPILMNRSCCLRPNGEESTLKCEDIALLPAPSEAQE